MSGVSRTRLALLSALSLALGCTAASAEPIELLDLVVPALGQSGSIGYSGGLNPLTGAGIDVESVAGLPNGPSYLLQGGKLTFFSGGLTSSAANTWNFGAAGAGSIQLIGAVQGANIANGILFSGAIENAAVLSLGGSFRIAGASFSVFPDPVLVRLFGLPEQAAYAGNFNIGFLSNPSTPPNAFYSTRVLSGDVTATPIPVPSALVLLGSGFAFLRLFPAVRLLRQFLGV